MRNAKEKGVKRMTLCFDFDGTICETEFKDGVYNILKINEDVVAMVNKLHKEGHTIIIFTARHWDKLANTMSQVGQIGINYDSLVMGKPVADFYIDDRALRPDEFVKLFKNYNGGKDDGKQS
jgi:uncharacterized HAD superfamily protein